ncbi:hypothetical protein TNCV_974661 [Trichonephila clavipes]|nr:hypothetical protein TNCV_974661 [Trichonephila clavipes]
MTNIICSPLQCLKPISSVNEMPTLQEVEKYDHSCKTSLLGLKQFCPEQLKVALTVTALSPTQVSMERLFFALKFIKSCLQSSIKEDLAGTMLFLRN